jgi:hypothetical protein
MSNPPNLPVRSWFSLPEQSRSGVTIRCISVNFSNWFRQVRANTMFTMTSFGWIMDCRNTWSLRVDTNIETWRYWYVEGTGGDIRYHQRSEIGSLHYRCLFVKSTTVERQCVAIAWSKLDMHINSLVRYAPGLLLDMELQTFIRVV